MDYKEVMQRHNANVYIQTHAHVYALYAVKSIYLMDGIIAITTPA